MSYKSEAVRKDHLLSCQCNAKDDRISDKDIVIRVQDLSKCYQVYNYPHDRLKQSIFPKLSKFIGKQPKTYYREFWALKDVSFSIRKGETVGIIGRNGSGKSTLLQMICGTLYSSSGTVETRGRIASLLELGSGFNPEFNGRENVHLNARLLGLSSEEIQERFSDIIGFADIGEFIDQPIKTYSSGMMVRLAFAVIANVDADILIIDEALAVGDAFFVQKCMRFLRKFVERGTLLFVSHDTSAIVNLCTRAILLNKGLVEKEGIPKDVTEHYLAALYEEKQGRNKFQKSKYEINGMVESNEYCDMRKNIFNSSTLRNDIEIFQFRPESSSFGTGDAIVLSVRILNQNGEPLSWLVGGENVRLLIECGAQKDLGRPIVGFFLKDRLGQILFGDNTYIIYKDNPIKVESGKILETVFDFRMPVLPSGDYSFSVAIAEGTQIDHVQHHWMHDALIIKVHSSVVCFGLIGIPMHNIRMAVR